jgi:hypothetical protein
MQAFIGDGVLTSPEDNIITPAPRDRSVMISKMIEHFFDDVMSCSRPAYCALPSLAGWRRR